MTDQTTPPAMSDADMLARFQNSKKRPACSDTLGMRVTSLSQADKSLTMDFEVPDSFANPTGAVQGGFIAALLDEAMGTVCIIASNVTMTAPTLEMKISYFQRLMPGPARVTTQVLKWGKSVVFLEASCFDPDGRLVAKATATALPKAFMRHTK